MRDFQIRTFLIWNLAISFWFGTVNATEDFKIGTHIDNFP